MKRFGGLTNEEATRTIRELCTQTGLMDFETAAVTNLQPQNFDEAKTLVPSIEVGARGRASGSGGGRGEGWVAIVPPP